MVQRSNYATFPRARLGKSSANCLSQLFFWWCVPLISAGNQRQLDLEDIWPLQNQVKSKYATMVLQRSYIKTGSIAQAFLVEYGWIYLLTALGGFVSQLLPLLGPVVLNQIVSTASNVEIDGNIICKWLVVLLISKIVRPLCWGHSIYMHNVIGIQYAAGIKGLLFQKSMKLSSHSKSTNSGPSLSNLYTSDMDLVVYATKCACHLLAYTLEIVVGFYLLYNLIGIATFAGVGVIILVSFLATFVSKQEYVNFQGLMNAKDSRMQTIKETFGSILTVKLNAWKINFRRKSQP